ncbi:hypothetical protein C8J55DRAFT_499433 [Lentinula edodes]|uniref:Secreted protein n=1 Tax=Lentinula lateritia TaxID=40482 RepID=A0A9W9E028_9AGAR|nr:hypothetical protein C8J55DRAFT_499433 [Lentinula edodes]
MLLPIRLIVIVSVGVSLFVGSATAVGPSRQDRHYRNLQQPWIGGRLECSGQTNEKVFKKDLTKELQTSNSSLTKGKTAEASSPSHLAPRIDFYLVKKFLEIL